MDRIRIGTLQYLIRPISTFDEFRDQVTSLAETAADYDCQLLVFPEYFTVQLLTLGDVRRPMAEQMHTLAAQVPRFIELMSSLSRKHALYILAGTIPVYSPETQLIHNTAHFFGPNGDYGTQGKLHMTRFESEEWMISPSSGLKIFETAFGSLAITICYDVEFPDVAREAARRGARLLLVPSCTDDRQGFLRVRYCAQARAIENQMYVIQSSTVGSLPMVPAVHLNYGQASILTPSDFPFARDGILAEGNINQEMLVIGEINLETIMESRKSGTVLPLLDSVRTTSLLQDVEVVRL